MYKVILKNVQKPYFVEITSPTQTCTGCLWRRDGVTCDAFPDSIPPAILLGAHDHHFPYVDDSYDDMGITFEKDIPD